MEGVVVCKRCSATWLNGQHRWLNNNKPGNELDLVGLVCNRVNDPNCINPKKGQTGGQTFESRTARVYCSLQAHGVNAEPVDVNNM